MNNNNKLTDQEFKQLLNLVKRYTETEMDQFDHWKFQTKYGKVYVEISREISSEIESWFTEMDNLLEN